MDKSQKTKKYIIEKASPIFNKKGYHGTSLSDLTKAIKLSKGSIYGNFDNKDDVAINCFLFNVGKIISIIQTKMKGINDPIEKLLVYSNVYKDIYKSIIENGGCPVANTLIEADDTHSQLYNLALDVIHSLESNIVSIIDEGKACGRIIENTESLKIAQVIITLFEGGIILTKSTDKDSYMINAIEQVEKIIQSIEK